MGQPAAELRGVDTGHFALEQDLPALDPLNAAIVGPACLPRALQALAHCEVKAHGRLDRVLGFWFAA